MDPRGRRIFRLKPQECGDGSVPLLRPAVAADRLRRATHRRRVVVGLALAIAGLALGPGQGALTLRFVASSHT